MKQFYFMFSAGEYSDYGVSGIYVCDHEVTKHDWHCHYLKYQEERQKQGQREDETWDEFYDRGGYEALSKWEDENDPESTFQKLHGMQRLDVVECWRDA